MGKFPILNGARELMYSKGIYTVPKKVDDDRSSRCERGSARQQTRISNRMFSMPLFGGLFVVYVQR